MKLLGEIVDLAVEGETSLSVLLRKCLVLSHRLKNERLKAWAEKELDGYADDDALPDYCQTHTLSKGLFFSRGWRMDDYAFPTSMLEERHRAMTDNAAFREGVAALQLDPQERNGGRQLRIPCPPKWSRCIKTQFSKAVY
jgi:AbiTii